MKSVKLKSKTAKSLSPLVRRLLKSKRAADRFGPESYEDFREAMRKLREDYDPGYGEFVRSIRDTDFYSGLPIPDDSK